MNTNIEKIKEQIAVGEAFAAKYPSEQITHDLSVWEDGVTLSGFANDAAIFGEVFGKEGWLRKVNHNGTKHDWHKTVHGVRLSIYGAEGCAFNNSPVNPKDFPILLK